MNSFYPKNPKGGFKKEKIFNMVNIIFIRTERPKSPLGDLGVGFPQSWRAATRNPVEALRYE
jgi:hypothetical protein